MGEEEARVISDFCHARSAAGTRIFVDPIMGDNGALYAGVPEATIGHMRRLLEVADYTVPNYTEACLLTGRAVGGGAGEGEVRYAPEDLSPASAYELVDAVRALGAKSVVVTSAQVAGQPSVVGYDHVAQEHFTLPFDPVPTYFPGTGDIFSSVLLGRVLGGWTLERATRSAMDVVRELIVRNAGQADKSAGIPIESCLDVIG